MQFDSNYKRLEAKSEPEAIAIGQGRNIGLDSSDEKP
jgi:hypothetical protein